MAEVETSSDISSESVVAAFKASINGPAVKNDDPVIKKCIEMCIQNGMAPSDLVTKWEAHCDKIDYAMENGPTVAHLESIGHILIKKRKEAMKPRSGTQMGMRTPYTKERIPELKENRAAQLGNKRLAGSEQPVFGSPSFVTPAKRRGGPETPSSLGPPSSRARMLPQTPMSESSLAPTGDAPGSVYASREQPLKILSTLNEALAEATQCATGAKPRCEVHVLQGVQAFRYMFETTGRRCAELTQRLKAITDGIVAKHGLRERVAAEGGGELGMAPVGARSQEAAWFCGRVCCEGDVGQLNGASVVLEGANGRRVKLDLAHVSEFAMFPGQIVVVYGSNTTGECITVREVLSDGSAPMVKTPASQIALFNETESFLNRSPMSIFAAAGPFTIGADLAYKPLEDLLEHVQEVKPDVVILCGPVADCRHKLLNPAMAGAPGGFSNGDPPDSLQVVRHVMRDKIGAALRTCPGTVCVVLPAVQDLHARSVFPQPAFEAEVFRPAEGEAEHRVELRTVSNPCTLRVNEVVIGVSSADVLLALSGNEAAKAVGGDRLARLARHVVHQRSFYPLFPPAEGTQLSMSHVQELALDVTPDVLILPSQLAPFAKRAGDVLCINPGRLCKGVAAGTFARLSVHPVVRHLRTAARKAAGDAGGAVEEEVVPQQLSQDFESAAKEEGAAEGEGKEVGEDKEGGGEGEGNRAGAEEEGGAASERAVGGEGTAGAEAEQRPGDVTMAEAEGVSEAAPKAETGKEEGGDGEDAGEEEEEKAGGRHAPTLHRVLDRTRVDIVRI